MNKNDYRRALIMLRALSGSYTGHVRLERRTLMGTLQITVSGPTDPKLTGLLLGDKGGQWYGSVLGTLKSDRRDQSGLLASIDPRNISRRDLDDYALVGVAGPSGLLMSGFLNGSRQVDWAAAAQVVAQLCGTPAATAGEPVMDLPPQESVTQQQARLIAEEAQQLADAGCTCDVTDEGADCVCPPAAVESTGFYVAPTGGTAPEGMAIDRIEPGATWPESALSVRTLFEQNPAEDPFSAPGYTFIRAPLGGAESGEYCLIGLKCDSGQVSTLCYAIPGEFALEPPVGLEGYSWRGAGAVGYWTTCIDLQSGDPVEVDDP